MTDKCCSKCKDVKPISEFGKDKNKKDGLDYWCKVCRRARFTKSYKQSPEKAKAAGSKRYTEKYRVLCEYKTSRGCCKCGETYANCLEFHHTDPAQKEFEVSESMNRNIDHIMTEIEKCVILCSNCHRKVHGGLIEL